MAYAWWRAPHKLDCPQLGRKAEGTAPDVSRWGTFNRGASGDAMTGAQSAEGAASIAWEHWRDMREIRVWQALCLSLGIDPEAEGSDQDLAKNTEFRRRRDRLLPALSDRNLFSAASLNMGDPLLGGVNLTEFAAWFLAHITPMGDAPDALLRIGYPLAIERQERARKSEGRYTLEEAAELLQKAGEDYHAMLSKLERAAVIQNTDDRKALTMHAPGRLASLEYGSEKGQASRARPFYEHAFWDELNRWLERNEPRISYRFPNPAGQPREWDWMSDLAKLMAKDAHPSDYLAHCAKADKLCRAMRRAIHARQLHVFDATIGNDRPAEASEPEFPKGDYPLRFETLSRWAEQQPAIAWRWPNSGSAKGMAPSADSALKLVRTEAVVAKSAPAVSARAWWDVAGTYVVELQRARRFGTAKALYGALWNDAVSMSSPFVQGKDDRRGVLILRATNKPVSSKALANSWLKVRTAAASG